MFTSSLQQPKNLQSQFWKLIQVSYEQNASKRNHDGKQTLDELAYYEHRDYSYLPLDTSWNEIGKISPSLRWMFLFGCGLVIQMLIQGVVGLVFTGVNFYYIAQNNLTSGNTTTSVIDRVQAILEDTNVFYWISSASVQSQMLYPWYGINVFNVVMSLLLPYCVERYIRRVKDRSNINSSTFNPAEVNEYPGVGPGGFVSDAPILPSIRTTNHESPLTGMEIDVPTRVEGVLTNLGFEISNNIGEKFGDDLNSHVPNVVKQKVMAQIQRRNKWKTRIGRLCSALVWGGLLLLLAYLVYTISSLHQSYTTATSSYWIVTFSLAILLTIITVVWLLLAHVMTQWENHQNNQTFDASYFLKTWMFQMMSNLILYNLLQFNTVNSSGQIDISSFTQLTIQCPYENLAQQYISSVIVELTAQFFSSIVLFWLQRKAVGKFCKNSLNGHNRFNPYVNLADEYVNLTQKIYILISGSVDLPLLGLPMALATYLELHFTKYKLLRFSAPIVSTNETFYSLLLVATLISAAVGYWVPPNGVAFLLYGQTHSCQSFH